LLANNGIAVPPPKKRRKLELDATLGDYSKGLVTATEDAAALEETYVFLAEDANHILNRTFVQCSPVLASNPFEMVCENSSRGSVNPRFLKSWGVLERKSTHKVSCTTYRRESCG
jgi:hypothetical protein